jgi:epoxyqueuosine reductase
MKLAARADLMAPKLADLVRLDDTGFRRFFAGSPVKRLGHKRFLRNVLIAVGNSGDRALLPAVEARLGDDNPLVRGAAVWAVRQLAGPGRLARLRVRHLAKEHDAQVAAEWQAHEEAMEISA